jgi:hypothetical protein
LEPIVQSEILDKVTPPPPPLLLAGPGYAINIFISGDVQKRQSVLSSANIVSKISSFVQNLADFSLETSFVSIAPSSSNPGSSWTSSSQIYSPVFQSTLPDDTGIQTYISSVNTIYTCNFAKIQRLLRLFFQALLHSQKRRRLAAICGFYPPAASCQQVAAGLVTSSTCSKPDRTTCSKSDERINAVAS